MHFMTKILSLLNEMKADENWKPWSWLLVGLVLQISQNLLLKLAA
jgi:hypothetical protein